MKFDLLKNVGVTIKYSAIVTFVLSLIATLVGAIAIFVAFIEADNGLFGLLVATGEFVGGVSVSLLIMYLIYGFGIIVELCELQKAEKYPHIIQAKEKDDNKTPSQEKRENIVSKEKDGEGYSQLY